MTGIHGSARGREGCSPDGKRQQPAGRSPLAEVVCYKEGTRRRAEAAENGAQAINHVLLTSVSESGALAESGKGFRVRLKARQAKLGGTEVD